MSGRLGEEKRDIGALALLRQYVMSGNFREQDQLPPERELAARLGLTRSQVRTGLNHLEAQGLIWRHVGRGTFMGARPIEASLQPTTPISRTTPREVVEARLASEPFMARLAALNATDEQIEAMRSCVVHAPSAEHFINHDAHFHRLIAESTNNALLVALYDLVHRNRPLEVWNRISKTFLTAERLVFYEEQHGAILRAIEHRDPVEAETAMRKHLETMLTFVFGGT